MTVAFRNLPPSIQRILRRGKFRAGATAEKGFRKTILDAEVADKPRKGRSEKSRSAWRNDPRRDEKIFSIIMRLLKSGQPVRVSRKAADTVSQVRKNLKAAALSGRRIIPELGLPHWDHSSDLLKMLGWGLASWSMNATPFSLRVSPDVIKAAQQDARGVGRHLQDRLARHLRQRLPERDQAFWFSVEQGLREEAHLHGAVVIPAGAKKEVSSALKAAGGKWRSSPRQLQFSPRGNLTTWVGYATKWLYGSKMRLQDENLTGASRAIRRQARLSYQEARSTSLTIYP